jgi:hypothetical protein
MASSSRPFESQTVSRLVAGYRNLRHGAKTMFRQGRLALLWGVQVAVFPAYVALQGVRTGYRRLQRQHPWQVLKGILSGKPVQAIPVTADTPLRALLSAIQPQPAAQGGRLRPVNYHGAFLRQSHTGRVLTNGGWHLVPVKSPIRGIASDLATGQLVLVTGDNTVFKDLTEDQQGRLESAITLLMAEYASQHKQTQIDRQLQQPGLPLPTAQSNQWFVVRWLNQAMRWMQTGSLAAVTNLFGEAQQHQSLPTDVKLSPLLLSSRAQSHHLLNHERYWMQPREISTSPVTMQDTRLQGRTPYRSEEQHPVLVLKPQSNQSLGNLSGQLDAKGLSTLPENEIVEFSWAPDIKTIDAQISQVTYVDRWLGQLLRWIDGALLWLEQTAKRLWQRRR